MANFHQLASALTVFWIILMSNFGEKKKTVSGGFLKHTKAEAGSAVELSRFKNAGIFNSLLHRTRQTLPNIGEKKML